MIRMAIIPTFVAALALCAPVEAAQFVFTATLSGANEVPPVVTPATGFITVVADDVAGTFAVTESWSGLSSAVTGAHIHCCAPVGVNTGIVIPFTPFPTTTSGSYVNTFTPAGFATILAGMKAGQAYANIHTANFGGGEIRGQLAAVPEAGSWAMMVAGFALVGAAMRRRGDRLAKAG